MTDVSDDEDLTLMGAWNKKTEQEKEEYRKLFPTDTPVCPLFKAKDPKPKVWFDGKLHFGDSVEAGIFSKDLNNLPGEHENKPVTARGIYVKFSF